MKKSILFGGIMVMGLSLVGLNLLDSNVASAQGPAGRGNQERGMAQGRPEGPPPNHGERQGPEGMLFALLDLTDEQKEQIKNIHDAERQTGQPYRDQLRATHEQLRETTKDGAFDETVVRSLLNQTQKSRIELEVLQLKTRAAIFNVLTPAQKAKFNEMLAKLERNHEGPPPPPQR